MTREEAIAELKRDIELENDFTEDYKNAVNMAIKALEQELKWIPVSESLPKYNKTVLVSVKQKGKEAMVFTAQRRRRVKTPDLFECCMDDEGWWDFRIAAWDDHEIIAWMPLPEPYQEGEKK